MDNLLHTYIDHLARPQDNFTSIETDYIIILVWPAGAQSTNNQFLLIKAQTDLSVTSS